MQYKVQAGDTLSKIADFLLNNMSRWPEIARANNLKAPYTIEIGQILNVPEIVPLQTSRPSQVISTPVSTALFKTPFGLPPKVFGIPTNYLLFGAAALLLIPLFMWRK
jgi:murein DD-endopeptidase MepM/ murein hydrolase activator NlpD